MIAHFFFMSFQKAVGSCIYELRERTGLTLDQLAERSGVSESRLRAIERGEVDIKLGTLLLLAMSLDVTLPELFGCIAGKLSSPQTPPQGRLIIFPKLGKAQSKP
jgi:transcriptional regulator with XRE-family HTH domain